MVAEALHLYFSTESQEQSISYVGRGEALVQGWMPLGEVGLLHLIVAVGYYGDGLRFSVSNSHSNRSWEIANQKLMD